MIDVFLVAAAVTIYARPCSLLIVGFYSANVCIKRIHTFIFIIIIICFFLRGFQKDKQLKIILFFTSVRQQGPIHQCYNF